MSQCRSRFANTGERCMLPDGHPPAHAGERGGSWMVGAEERRALTLAHAINEGSTEGGAAIRAHLITMGWRPPT